MRKWDLTQTWRLWSIYQSTKTISEWSQKEACWLKMSSHTVTSKEEIRRQSASISQDVAYLPMSALTITRPRNAHSSLSASTVISVSTFIPRLTANLALPALTPIATISIPRKVQSVEWALWHKALTWWTCSWWLHQWPEDSLLKVWNSLSLIIHP